MRVILFPIPKRIGKIKRTADILMEKRGKAAASYWRQVVGGLNVQLERIGIPEDERREAVMALFDAVQAELVRRQLTSRWPGGDAA